MVVNVNNYEVNYNHNTLQLLLDVEEPQPGSLPCLEVDASPPSFFFKKLIIASKITTLLELSINIYVGGFAFLFFEPLPFLRSTTSSCSSLGQPLRHHCLEVVRLSLH